ncbi:hypothetical protein PYCCODRAFT_1184334 [Trametes coccinea BRFM310]|uniref:Uncharacterized protein n=1 Tax=Trametes coccinea (strain BRFM310) TaxID=1353009 RepID=A0A1Y2J083_TRAC3|nr:hypothetical protein PYCCODRAFT_1184334 [Trametes coccinea BRFM310]
MEGRLHTLLAMSNGNSVGHGATDVEMEDGGDGEKGEELRLPAGWRKLSERDGWRPAPIGVYVSLNQKRRSAIEYSPAETSGIAEAERRERTWLEGNRRTTRMV